LPDAGGDRWIPAAGGDEQGGDDDAGDPEAEQPTGGQRACRRQPEQRSQRRGQQRRGRRLGPALSGGTERSQPAEAVRDQRRAGHCRHRNHPTDRQHPATAEPPWCSVRSIARAASAGGHDRSYRKYRDHDQGRRLDGRGGGGQREPRQRPAANRGQ
jgi:hypothetical protein